MACLEPDLKNLQAGDRTEIGERGINLSGGQKQRISIARAVYSESDVYVSDDCLAALDPEVAQSILENVFLGCLKAKTVVLATHRTDFLEKADLVVLMQEGRIAQKGHFRVVRNSPQYLKYTDEVRKVMKEEKNQTMPAETEEGLSASEDTPERPKDTEEAQELNKPFQEAQKPSESQTTNNGQLITKESRFTGLVDFSVFTYYISKVGLSSFLLCTTFFLASSLLAMTVDWWLGKWISQAFALTQLQYLTIYALLIVASLTAYYLKYLLFAFYGSQTSFLIFKSTFNKLLKRPMQFFDTTPSGVIQNRMTNDVETVDRELPRTLSSLLDILFVVISAYAVAVYTSPLVLVIFVLTYVWFVKMVEIFEDQH